MATKTAKNVATKPTLPKAAAKQSNSLKASAEGSRKTVSAGYKSAAKPQKQVAPKLAAVPLAHRLDALLHTMRSIAQHEDELCTLLHDTRRTGKISSAVLRELKAVLAALPAQEYTDDLQAVLQMTGMA